MKGLDTWQYQMLKKISDTIAIRYMSEVFLVGSFITKGLNASDIDIIMVCSDKRITHLFGTNEWNDKRKHLYWKIKTVYENTIHDMDIDFKIQTYEEFNKINESKIKLDNEVYNETNSDNS